MLGTIAIVEDLDFVRLSEFSFWQFETSAIRKLTKASKEAYTTFKWMSGKAIMLSKGTRIVNRLSIKIDNESGWKKVKKAVEG